MSTKEGGVLIGTWRLVAYETRDSTGQLHYPMGQHVTSQLIYDSGGKISAHMMRNEGATFASNDPGQVTDAETRAAFEGHISYFGTYSVDAAKQTVRQHLQGCSYPN